MAEHGHCYAHIFAFNWFVTPLIFSRYRLTALGTAPAAFEATRISGRISQVKRNSSSKSVQTTDEHPIPIFYHDEFQLMLWAKSSSFWRPEV